MADTDLVQAQIQADAQDVEVLLATAKQLASLKQLDDAMDLMQQAMTITIDKYDEMHIACAPLYLEYGRMLLESAKQSIQDLFSRLLTSKLEGEEGDDDINTLMNKPLSEVVTTQCKTLDDALAKEGSEEEKKGKEERGKEEKGKEEKGKEEKETSTTTSASAMADEESGEEGGEGEGEEDQEGAGAYDTFGLSWEWLQTAKLILEKYIEANKDEGNTFVRMLADVHEVLGEHSTETDNEVQAIEDYSKCLELRQTFLEADDRLLGETHYFLGLAYQLAQQAEKSLEQYQLAHNVIEKNINELREKKVEGVQLTDLESVLEELKGKMEEVTAVVPIDENMKKELAGKTTIGFGEVKESDAPVRMMGVFGDSVGTKRPANEALVDSKRHKAAE